jgi:hypothetical protein
MKRSGPARGLRLLSKDEPLKTSRASTAQPVIVEDAPLPTVVNRLSATIAALVPQPPVPFAVAVPAAGIAPDDNCRRLGNRVRASGRKVLI